jgi:hypothetical protein
MVIQIRIPVQFGASNAAAWFESWGKVRDEQDLLVWLPGDAFLYPAGIVLLAAGIADRQDRGLRTSLSTDLPGCDAYRYLQRVDFFSTLGVKVDEVFERHDSSGKFVPLRRISDLATARAVAEETSAVLEAQLPDVGPSPLRMARFILEELGANIVQHSSRPVTGFGMAQAFPKARRIEVAFADAGVGFLKSLQRNPELAGRVDDEGEALQLALGRGLSSRTEGRGNMGIGLHMLVNFSDAVQGDLKAASGDALLHRRTVVGSERTNTVRPTAGWRGSWICLLASLP